MMFDEATLFPYIGYAAGLATILTFTIQIMKIIETKKITNLSSYMYIIYALGLICWAAYGVYIDNWLIVIANLITFIFTFIILILILYYDAEDKIERARRDELTYVFNRSYFEQTAPIKLAENKAQQQHSAILVVSAKNHNEIQKKYGSKISNKLLKTLAKFLEKDLRENDMVARYEDDKFIVFLSGADNKAAQLVTKRLLANANDLKIKTSKNEECAVAIKIGSCSTEYYTDIPQLIKEAQKDLTEN